MQSGHVVAWSGDGIALVVRLIAQPIERPVVTPTWRSRRSRQFFTQQRLTEAACDQRAQWKIVKELLHVDDRRTDEARRLCRQSSKFFMDKLRRIAVEISPRLSASSLRPVRPPVTSAHLPVLQDFEQVTTDDVAKLIRQLPP